jgi:hypothetical protein
MTNTSEPTIVASHNKSVVAIVITLIIGLAIGAFVLSFDALHALAIASAIEPNLAWIWPIIIDGFIVTATIAIFSLRGRGRTWYPWASLILFACVSVFGNSIHAVNNQDILGVSVWIASSVSAAPAIALLLASHFLVIMISAPRKVYIDEIEVHSTHEPDKTVGAATLSAPFEEPRIVVTPLPVKEEKFIAPVMEPYVPPVAPIRKVAVAEPTKPSTATFSPVTAPELVPETGVRKTTPTESVTTPVVRKIVEPIVDKVPLEPVVTTTIPQEKVEKSVEPKETPVERVVEVALEKIPSTEVVTPKKPNIVSDEEIIEYLKSHDKNAPASKLSEVFGLSERTIHRRIRKLKDKFGESLERL